MGAVKGVLFSETEHGKYHILSLRDITYIHSPEKEDRRLRRKESTRLLSAKIYTTLRRDCL